MSERPAVVSLRFEADFKETLTAFEEARKANEKLLQGIRDQEQSVSELGKVVTSTSGALRVYRTSLEALLPGGKGLIEQQRIRIANLKTILAEKQKEIKASDKAADKEAERVAKAAKDAALSTKTVQDFIAVYKQKLTSVAQVEAEIRRLNQELTNLRYTQQGLNVDTEKERNEIAVRVAALKGLKTELAAVAAQQKEATKTTHSGAKAWGAALKKMVLWGIGAASAYRLFMKIRRVITETIKELFQETEEYKRLTAATDTFKAALLAVIGGEEDWLEALDNMGKAINESADGIVRAAGVIKGYFSILDEAGRRSAKLQWQLIAMGAHFVGNEELALKYANAVKVLGDETSYAQLWLDAYADTQEDYVELQELHIEKTKEQTEAEKRYADYLEKYTDAFTDYVDDLVNLYEEYSRRLEDIERDFLDAVADMQLDAARKREDIERTYRRKLEDIERTTQDDRRKAEEDYRRKLIEIEMRYREQLIRIEEDFGESMYDAISKRDATAALRAIRKRNQDTARATRQRDDARQLAQMDYDKAIRDQARQLERMREDARIARERALEDLRIDLERERQDIELTRQRELEDLEKYLADTREKIEAEYETARIEADAWYKEDERLLHEHLQRKLQEYADYYGELATMIPPTYGAPGTQIIPPSIGFAEGGSFVTQGPTMALFGERGPELVVAQPMGSSTGTVNHIVSGAVQQQVDATISRSIAGFEGRLQAAMLQVMRDVYGP